LIRKYSFIYTKPVFITISGVFIMTIIVSAGVFFLDSNQRFARLGEGRDIPILGDLEKRYRGGGLENITHGEVIEISEESFKIRTFRKGEIYSVFFKNKNNEIDSSFALGDKVMIIGEKKDYIIEADVIKKSDFLPFEKKERRESFDGGDLYR
jgi:hypothetical protein